VSARKKTKPRVSWITFVHAACPRCGHAADVPLWLFGLGYSVKCRACIGKAVAHVPEMRKITLSRKGKK